MNKRRPAPGVLAGAVCFISVCLTLGLAAVRVLLELDSSYEPADSLLSSLPEVFMVLAFALVGGIVTLKVLVGFAVVWAVISTAPGQLEPPLEAYENPLALTSSEGYIVTIFPIIGVCLVCVALAAVSLLLRFRRSRGEERQQFKWFAGSAGLLLLTLPFAAAFDWSGVPSAAFGVALIALPVSVGIAVLRYRLYEIDRMVKRTLAHASLWLREPGGVR